MSSNGLAKNPGVAETSQNGDDTVDESPPENLPKRIKPLGRAANEPVPPPTTSDVKPNYSGLQENQGTSTESQEVHVVHPLQSMMFKSSEDLLLVTPQSPNSMESQNSVVVRPGTTKINGEVFMTFLRAKFSSDLKIQSDPKLNLMKNQASLVIRPDCTKMNDEAFKSFLQVNFPSGMKIQSDPKSRIWAGRVLTPEQFISIDKSTQSSTVEGISLRDVFSRPINTTTSQQTQFSSGVLPPRPIQGDPPLQGAPPSYSAVMRVGQNTPRRIFGRRLEPQVEASPPFTSRSPPPTYAEAQGRYYRPIVGVESDLLWGPEPMPATCIRCGCLVITAVNRERSNLTHFAALGLCLCGCWPCCLLPYCMNSCKNTYHYCPSCNTFLGVYRPW